MGFTKFLKARKHVHYTKSKYHLLTTSFSKIIVVDIFPRRHQRETEALKDVLASYQNNADNDVAHKISEYETTIADYEVTLFISSSIKY